MVSNEAIKIKKGSILVYRIYDVAEEISVGRVEEILRDNRGPDRFKVPKYIDRALVMKSPPVTFGLGEETLKLQGREIKTEVLVKVRDFGTTTFIYQIPVDGFSWQQLIQLACDLEEGSEIDLLSEQQRDEVVSQIKNAFKKPNPINTAFEDYIIYFIEEFEGPLSIKDLLSVADVPALLKAEEKIQLSPYLRDAVLSNTYQYGDNDLAIIEWNSALVIEPGGGREVPDILEFAVTHLLEMRYYDDLLEAKLALLYDDIEKKRTSILGSRFSKTAEEASSRYIEFTEFIERVENSLKVVGDFYLATIYREAARRFRISDWQQSVTRKMNILAQVSSLLQGEINNRRSHLLEIIIILLIAYEIISAAMKF